MNNGLLFALNKKPSPLRPTEEDAMLGSKTNMWLWLQRVLKEARGGAARQRWCCPPEVVLPARGGAARQRWCCPPEVVLPARGGAARQRWCRPPPDAQTTLASVIASSTFINLSLPLLTDKHEHHVVLWSNPDVKNWRASFKYPGPYAPTHPQPSLPTCRWFSTPVRGTRNGP